MEFRTKRRIAGLLKTVRSRETFSRTQIQMAKPGYEIGTQSAREAFGYARRIIRVTPLQTHKKWRN